MKYLLVLFLAACSSQTRAPSSKNEFRIGPSEGGSEIVALLQPVLHGDLVTGVVDCHSGFDMNPTACDLFNTDGSPGPRVVKEAAQKLWRRLNAVKLKAYPNGALDESEIDAIRCTPEGDCVVRVTPAGGAA